MITRLSLPITIKGKSIKNRIVMPPMVLFGQESQDGFVTPRHIQHYEARAKGGTGLIIVEATSVRADGRLSEDQLGIWSDEHVEGLREIATACHNHGASVIIQLHHAGLKTPSKVSSIAVGPSEDNERPSRALTIEEIEAIGLDFIKAAKRAQQAGFDGIELHGAHGYLLSQFASPITNLRQDEYGGELLGRMKLALDIINGIHYELGRSFIIAYRMGGNEPTLEDGIKIAKLLEESGIDLIHVSSGIHSPTITPLSLPKGFPFNRIVYCGTKIRQSISVPVIVVNGIRTPHQAAFLVENKLADFVAVGRGHLADSAWADKAIQKLEVEPCLECPKCHWFTKSNLCPHQKSES